MKKMIDDILSYREMCDYENVQTLQRGMNFRLNTHYSVLLMSQRSNAPYNDRIHDDGITIEYEGHDMIRQGIVNPKDYDQPLRNPSGSLTQNGKFVNAVKQYKDGKMHAEKVKIYEKVMDGVWSLKGIFDLVDYKLESDGKRNVFKFILKLSKDQDIKTGINSVNISHTRLIPSIIKKEVWKRDGGRCVLCGETKNLHFDHDLPFSKGGTSLSKENVRLLCIKHNLSKSDRIE